MKEQIGGVEAGIRGLATRDNGARATFADIVGYFDWLGERFTDSPNRRRRIEAAAAIHDHGAGLPETLLHGTGIGGGGGAWCRWCRRRCRHARR